MKRIFDLGKTEKLMSRSREKVPRQQRRKPHWNEKWMLLKSCLRNVQKGQNYFYCKLQKDLCIEKLNLKANRRKIVLTSYPVSEFRRTERVSETNANKEKRNKKNRWREKEESAYSKSNSNMIKN